MTSTAFRRAAGFGAAAMLGMTTLALGQGGRPPAPGDPVEPTEQLTPPPIDAEWTDRVRVFEHVWIDRAEGYVDVAGIVPIVTSSNTGTHGRADEDADGDDRGDDADAEDDADRGDDRAATADVLLELIVTGFAGGRDHESLVMTRAQASHVHAALLLLGVEPGDPGRWTERVDDETDEWSAVPTPPSGPRLLVELRWRDAETGEERTASPGEWIRHADGETPFPDAGWVFAGSQFVRRQGQVRYDADFTGTIVGLAQFGSEVVAFSQPYHHDESYQEPMWFAKNDAVPPFGTDVTVRLSVDDDSAEDEAATTDNHRNAHNDGEPPEEAEQDDPKPN